eukprot:TRINITY_DN2662_c0_g1_i11.p1 TRINITY_DN2662_c0_g1~~TRINITY_DN2662_c0_g1_i11.p1  ORF type:complete len:274 (-),score=66.13 TRINITY_DN2662_c0_g1_i11:261-1082(-)
MPYHLGVKKLISSSGGNAGIAVAYAARKLGVPCVVVVPNTTPKIFLDKILGERSEVIVSGSTWSEAHQKAVQLALEPDTELIHPFDHAEIWEGHSSMIHEIYSQVPTPPSVVITVVGGGGLLIGIMKGLDDVGWGDVCVLASETEGAASFAASVSAGRLVTIPSITTVAKTLGAARVAETAFELSKTHNIHSCVVSDEQAIRAVLRLQEDHQILVEPSCGAGLSLLYDVNLFSSIVVPRVKEGDGVILVILCGGNGIDLKLLMEYCRSHHITY